MKTIGIDIGTTTISAVAFDGGSGEVLESRTVPNGCFIETENEWERIQDAGKIIEKTKEILDGLLDRHADTAAIGLTGQMHGVLYADARGRCLSPLYTWQDQRGNLPDPDGKSMVDVIRESCGETAAAGYGLVTHACLCKKGEAPRTAASLCTIPDYLGMVLTGREEPLLHASMAASLGFFDVRRGAFRKEKLETIEIDSSILPKVTCDLEILGNYRGRAVTAALGDNQASFLGSAGTEKDTVLVNVGTGGQISVLSGTFFETAGIEARPFTGGRFLLAGSSLCGGRAYAILEKFFRSYAAAAGLGDRSQYEVMAKLAVSGQAKGDPMKVVTTFHGTRVDPNLRGSISNLSEDNFTPQGLILGVLNGLAQELYDMFALIHDGTGIEARRLVASGNGVRKNAALRRIFEEMFHAKLQLAKHEEEAACGAAIAAWQSCGSLPGRA